MNPHEIDALKNAKQRLKAHSPSGFDKIVAAAAATIAEQCNDPCTVSIKEQFDSPLGHRRDPQGGRQVPPRSRSSAGVECVDVETLAAAITPCPVSPAAQTVTSRESSQKDRPFFLFFVTNFYVL